MDMLKKHLLYLSIISVAAVSCNKTFDPWNNVVPGQSDVYEDPEETNPVSSDITVDDESGSDDNVANTSFDGTISITFSSSDAKISGSVDGVSVSKSGAHVTVTNSGENKVKYILSGSSSDGSFKLYSTHKQALQLSNLSLQSSKGAAINNQSKKRTFIVLEGTNTLADCSVDSNGDYPDQTADEDEKAAFFSEGQLIFSGSGTLSVKAVGKAGITSDDYIRFMTGCNVSVTSSKGHGVRGKDAIIVSGGEVNVTVESGATGKKCFTTDSLIFVGGGNTTLANKASAGTVDGEQTGAACIKADQIFVIRGGNLNLTASGSGCKCISGDAAGYFEGGSIDAQSTGSNYGSSSSGKPGLGGNSSSSNSTSAKTIKFDGNLEFSGAQVKAVCSAHEAIESKGTIYISGGSIYAKSSDDAINSASTMTISDGVVCALSTGNDGLDSNGNLIIKGGTVYAVGCGSPEVGIDANTEQRYKFYLEGGNVIALGGIESGSSVSQNVISTSWSKNATYSLCDGDTALFTFKAPSSGGSGLIMSAPSLESNTVYTLKTSADVSGADSYFDGTISVGGTATGGGTSSSVKAYAYSSNGGGMGGGGGGGMGWR